MSFMIASFHNIRAKIIGLSVHNSTFNTSPTTINLLRAGSEYLTKSLEKQTKYSIFIS